MLSGATLKSACQGGNMCHLTNDLSHLILAEGKLCLIGMIPNENIEVIRNIAAHPEIFFDQMCLSTDEARIAINAISSQAITEEEASIGNFTRRELKKLNTWPSWEAGEHQQLINATCASHTLRLAPVRPVPKLII